MSAIGKTFRLLGKALVILFVIGLIGTLIDDNDTSSKTSSSSDTSYAPKVTDYSSRIKPYANQRYTVEQYPKTVAQFRRRLPEIERHKEAALRKAIDSGKCDIATSVELSTKSTLSKLIYWVDCQNGQRLWFDEWDF